MTNLVTCSNTLYHSINVEKSYCWCIYEFLSNILREISTFKCISSKTRPDLPTLSLFKDNGAIIDLTLKFP